MPRRSRPGKSALGQAPVPSCSKKGTQNTTNFICSPLSTPRGPQISFPSNANRFPAKKIRLFPRFRLAAAMLFPCHVTTEAHLCPKKVGTSWPPAPQSPKALDSVKETRMVPSALIGGDRRR